MTTTIAVYIATNVADDYDCRALYVQAIFSNVPFFPDIITFWNIRVLAIF